MIALCVRTPSDYLDAPEFEYLVSWVRSRVEAVAGPEEAVEMVEPERPEALARASSEGRLLVLDCRTLLGRRSLERMLEAVGSGARAVVPTRLADTGLPAEHPVYTLRGFERLEELALARDETRERVAGERAPWSAPLPALLLGPGVLGAVEEPVTAARLLDEPARVLPGLEPEAAGLCHAFVDYYGQAREDVLPLLPEGCRDVLEVGCGRGATGRLIQERTGARVTGVELNPVVARAAAEVLHRVCPGDVIRVAAELAGSVEFDALVAFELFEHLTEQGAFLEAARSLVRPGGRIVLSVPNVGHYSVVEDLLAGRWDYLPIGLLCFTHFRFFTRRTLEDWLRRFGFSRFELVAQRTELPERWVGRELGEALGFEVDGESLATKGFYVLIENV